MTATAYKEYHDCSARGKRLRVLKEVRGYMHVNKNGRRYEEVVTIQPGVIVTYLRHGMGPGSDPAYETVVRLESIEVDGRLAAFTGRPEVHIQVGWFDLRTDTFEVIGE